MRRLPPLLLVALVLAAPASGTGPAERKQQVDQRLSNLQDRISRARAREQALTAQVDSVTSQIRSLDRKVGDVSARLAPLERDLALHQRQLDRLNARVSLGRRRKPNPVSPRISGYAPSHEASAWIRRYG